jgi:phosphoglycerate dehydrogenase-like enzyme
MRPENGIDLLPLSGGDAQARIAELRPDGYVMNDPEYGPYLSVELAGAARDLRIVVYHGQTRTAADYEPFMDVTALRERGIVLTTGPGTVTEAVSEGTMGCCSRSTSTSRP